VLTCTVVPPYFQPGLPDEHRELEPPDPIPNSDVKRFIADGSVGFPHVRVGHCQAFNTKDSSVWMSPFFIYGFSKRLLSRVGRGLRRPGGLFM
jgi:hypothetical protein